ncbi:MAG TPA: DNA-binding transcriptional regulator [Thermoguttaceae bacterium]|nr:DNA-binding transcriptional regulator [Thermoguttaceae bacterium]HPP53551.1 DNA-binding transcriptional regulator [Thermoguttaceae bacterium]
MLPGGRRGIPHVALLVETSTSFGRRLLEGVADYIRQNGPWSVYVEQRSIYDPAPPWLKSWDGDGIISRAAYPELARLVVQLGIPVVDLNEQVLGLGLPLIFNDHQAIGRLAAEHLLERGFRHFGFIGHPGIYWAEERHRGFAQAVEATGFVCHQYRGAGKTRRRYHQQSWEQEMDQVADWVRRLPKPVGVMAANDFRAIQLLDACRRAEVAVPEEAAVVGVDDEEVACRLANPPLTSVVPDARRMGWEAAALLDRLMQGQPPPFTEKFIPPQGIVVRQSTEITAIEDPLLAAALSYIRQYACQGIRVQDIVRYVGLSRSALQRRFRHLLGRSIHQMLFQVRLERAKMLLAETDLTLADIAERAGFHYAEYLHCVFQKHFGMTPGQYRRQAAENQSAPSDRSAT